MRVVVQRVSEASVKIDGIQKSEIGIGIMILVGIEGTDKTGQMGRCSSGWVHQNLPL